MRSSTSGTVRVGRVHIFLESSEWQKHAQHQEILKSYSENIWHYFSIKKLALYIRYITKKSKRSQRRLQTGQLLTAVPWKKTIVPIFTTLSSTIEISRLSRSCENTRNRIKSSVCVFSKRPTPIIIINIRWCQISSKSDVLTWISNKQSTHTLKLRFKNHSEFSTNA